MAAADAVTERAGLIRLAELELDDPGDVRVARLVGELDLSNATDIADALAAAADGAALGLVLDLTGLRHIDSAGVRLLFDLRRRLSVRRQALALAVPPDARIRDVLEMAAVHETVPVTATVDEALAAVRSPRR
jgi:anti-anti-sigma factor